MIINQIDVAEINKYIGGIVVGDNISATKITSFEKIENKAIVFCKYIDVRPKCNCSGIIIAPLDYNLDLRGDSTLILVENPKVSFSKLISKVISNTEKVKISNTASISSTAVLGKNVTIGEFAVIGDDVSIGDNTTILEGCVIKNGVIIGSNCLLGSNSCIGIQGFGLAEEKNSMISMPHIGTVIIENDVHIGSLCTVAKGVIDDTIIGENSKISHNVNIGHNSNIGKNCIITGKSQISGSVIIGDNTWIGPNCSIIQKKRIGKDCTVGIGSVVVSDLPDGSTIMAPPSVRIKEFLNMKRMMSDKG